MAYTIAVAQYGHISFKVKHWAIIVLSDERHTKLLAPQQPMNSKKLSLSTSPNIIRNGNSAEKNQVVRRKDESKKAFKFTDFE